ncbi:MAG TPA: hypothetical protein VJG83_01875 [archaeon]|nr:hypothetical protein [archaeon]
MKFKKKITSRIEKRYSELKEKLSSLGGEFEKYSTVEPTSEKLKLMNERLEILDKMASDFFASTIELENYGLKTQADDMRHEIINILHAIVSWRYVIKNKLEIIKRTPHLKSALFPRQ